ncbi:quercetin dioxygenase-like cupin family protein [Desulfobaculum xiamenense]|uniref:Quercetin dioxygenase-like cupin family protein n=1 Tax=Desulfobaculum xiamenense TaxID=995050 RepID=A0A846QLN0_9BACT|nr:cupin domain-containing protein [Desulfobaculum xiamenense]NJB69078.1 quercetin dioxygenase-like cupin family protein [Desulfobaculum xiamenense]
MTQEHLIRNIPFAETLETEGLVEYAPGQVVSRTLARRDTVNITVFAFDAGESISTHSAPGDALVQVLAGEAVVTIDGVDHAIGTGQCIVMPANIPHGVRAEKRFKMLLTVVKP